MTRRALLAGLLLLSPICAHAQIENEKAVMVTPANPSAFRAENERRHAAKEAYDAEKKRVREEFRPLLEAAGLEAKASWKLLGADFRTGGQGADTSRIGVLYIQVDSDDRAQILLTTLLVARDIVEANRFDSFSLQAMGAWYTPDIDLPKYGTVEIHWSGPRQGEMWRGTVASGIPTETQLTVARAAKRLRAQHISGTTIEEQIRYLAEATHLSVAEVSPADQNAALRHGVDICVSRRRYPNWHEFPCRPDEVSIDPLAIQRPENFPKTTQVIDEMCKGHKVVPTPVPNVRSGFVELGWPHECQFGMPER